MEPTSSPTTRDIFNDSLGISSLPIQDEHAAFPQFSRLIPELRLYIWKLCLPPRRMISIRVDQNGTPRRTPTGEAEGRTDEDGDKVPPLLSYYTTQNILGNVVSSYPYHVHAPRLEQWSRALELVNRESHGAFSSFYRLVIPIYSGNKNRGALLRLNPDTDIVEVQKRRDTPAAALAAFFHDALANDPAGRGIAYLALGRSLSDVILLAELTASAKSEGSSSGSGRNQEKAVSPHALHPVAAASLRLWLQTGLRTFYSVIAPSIDARNMLGRLWWPSDDGKFHQNRSVPIAPLAMDVPEIDGKAKFALARDVQATEYSSVGPDPRPIEEADLAHVAVGPDPRWHVYSWYRVLDNLGVDRSKSAIQLRYLLAIWPDKWNVASNSRQGFLRFLEETESRFAWDMGVFEQQPWGDRIDEETWKRQQRTLSDVAGLWVFDADTFGDIPSLDETPNIFTWRRPETVKDLTATRPELLVFHLA